MADKKNEKILLIASDQAIGERLDNMLTFEGYDVKMVNSSYAAIATLEASAASPFALVISAYRMPGMTGDDLLAHARFLAPDTQRMLLAYDPDMKRLLNAINLAAIHSCIVIPFEDEEFMSEVSRRCEQFRRIQKRESLRKLTEHQNRQMYKIALNLKKTKEQFQQQIRQKQNIIKKLVSGDRAGRNIGTQTEKFSCTDTRIQNEIVAGEFRAAANRIRLLLERIAFDNEVKVEEIDELTLSSMINPDLQDTTEFQRRSGRIMDESYRNLIDTTINLLFESQISKSSGVKPKQLQPQSAPLEESPTEPVDGRVVYFFEDLHSSGIKPFVLKNTLLAEKIPCKAGLAGIDATGNPIPVREPIDPLFTTGINASLSDDRLKIFATADGQPHLDFMGVLSVFPELHLKGDVNYDTGDISFNGNITVDGVIKDGCSVKCATLTAQTVEGAKIQLTGDLNVTSGIIDAHVVNVQGNVHARYINNSRIKALGDVVVQKEIIHSELFIGGQCINRNGLIASSFINSRKGIVAGRIGTAKSSPSKLEVGTEGIIEMMIADLDERVAIKSEESRALKEEVSAFESEEDILHGKISDAVNIQNRAQMELIGVEKQLPEIESSEDIMEVRRMLKMVKDLQEMVDNSEKIINGSFERQDAIVEQTIIKQRKSEAVDSEIESIRLKQQGLREFCMRSQPRAEVCVNIQIMSGTSIAATKSKLLLKEDISSCRIYEAAPNKRSGTYEIVIGEN